MGLGRALLALGQLDEALRPLRDCVEFHPKDPACYQARLVSSRVYLEKGEIENARQLLLDNLHHESLTPESIEWRDSLFALGKLYYLEGVRLQAKSRAAGVDTANAEARKTGLKTLEKSVAAFHKAVEMLGAGGSVGGYVERYPDGPQVIQARYLVAQAHRRSALLPLKRLQTETIGRNRELLNNRVRSEMQNALEMSRQLQITLNERLDKVGLSQQESAILRNCYFAQPAVMQDLGQYDEAIRAYLSATSRYRDEPESLEAFVQIAHCHRQLNRAMEARATLEQAKLRLSRIRPDADFTTTTRYTRDQWVRVLEWSGTL